MSRQPIGSRLLRIACVMAILGTAGSAASAAEDGAGRLTLASGGKTEFSVAVSADPTNPEIFAATELATYLQQISGAEFPLASSPPGKRILFEDGRSLPDNSGPEAYSITIRGDDLVLSGRSDRARLYAVYDLLERLGCRWLAPQYAFYEGKGEIIPKKADLVLELAGTTLESPDFAIRKLDIEEGLSHTTENLKQLVAWAPKLRYNTLMVPRDYGGRGRVTWDHWREIVGPEAKRRGMIIEVGGHGYENFLHAKMEDGKLFERHPEWFGMDESGRRSRSKRQVFCTSNEQAVEFVTRGVLEYLAARPEIDVFEMWPPDGAEWCKCEQCTNLGEPQDRQALLVNRVQKALDDAGSRVRLEIIAYSKALLPPKNVKLDERILIDFCPINQSFEVPINDPRSERNAEYVAAITSWRKQFPGDIGLYSYYRKYAWKSLPALIPHYMKADLRFYRSLPLQGVMIYAEPGDWGTYELNHYALGKLGWKVDTDMHAVIRDFCAARYGEQHAGRVGEALVTLGDTVRTVGSLPFTSMKSPEQIEQAHNNLQQLAGSLPSDGPAFRRLQLMFDYALRDLQIQRARASKAPEAEVRKQVESILAFLTEHKDAGVFILTGRNDLDRFLKRYGLPATPPGPGE